MLGDFDEYCSISYRYADRAATTTFDGHAWQVTIISALQVSCSAYPTRTKVSSQPARRHLTARHATRTPRSLLGTCLERPARTHPVPPGGCARGDSQPQGPARAALHEPPYGPLSTSLLYPPATRGGLSKLYRVMRNALCAVPEHDSLKALQLIDTRVVAMARCGMFC